MKELPKDANTTPDKMHAGVICEKCGLDEWFRVRGRFENENVINYVKYIGKEAGVTHGLLSPVCGTPTVSLKLPITDVGIGFPGRTLTREEMEQLKKDNNL